MIELDQLHDVVTKRIHELENKIKEQEKTILLLESKLDFQKDVNKTCGAMLEHFGNMLIQRMKNS
jgi:uncharacterized coiled-coil protein SlyX